MCVCATFTIIILTITFMIYVLLPSPIYKWGNWGFKNLRKFPKFSWLVNGTVGTQIHAVSFQMLRSWSHLGLGDKTRWETEPGLPTAFQVAVPFHSPACSLAFPPLFFQAYLSFSVFSLVALTNWAQLKKSSEPHMSSVYIINPEWFGEN